MELNEDVDGSALEGNESSDSNEGNLPQAPGLHRKYSAMKGITGPRMCLLADAVPLSPVHSANVDPGPSTSQAVNLPPASELLKAAAVEVKARGKALQKKLQMKRNITIWEPKWSFVKRDWETEYFVLRGEAGAANDSSLNDDSVL